METASDTAIVRLTQYSHGAGCGCKISPQILSEILAGSTSSPFGNLLVGNSSRDDAAVMDLGDGRALISTTDFFMPVVDDPFDFGRIAAANAISDVYAMGGTPVMAIAILGWPIDKLPASVAARVLEGARSICSEAGMPLAGGHSIDCPEPVFGLAVNGLCPTSSIRANATATDSCKLYLTKPIGIGIITTAQKKGMVDPSDYQHAVDAMTTLNKPGMFFGTLDGVKALTDVTGFGLLGHLSEICDGSEVSAEIWFDQVPTLPNVNNYIERKCIPGGTQRNWKSYGQRVGLNDQSLINILCDPQTSGGLLVAVEDDQSEDFETQCLKENISIHEIGRTIPQTEKAINVLSSRS